MEESQRKKKITIRGHARQALQALVESMLTTNGLSLPTTGSAGVVERVDRFLSNSSRLVQLMFKFSILLFDWGVLFMLRFERFSRMPERARSRYIMLWMRHKVAFIRNIFRFLRFLILLTYYDTLGFHPAAERRI
jgi:hypothetical protein